VNAPQSFRVSGVDSSSTAGAEALLDGSVAEYVERTGAQSLRPAPTPGEACWSQAIVEDSEHDGRRPRPAFHCSLIRTVSARLSPDGQAVASGWPAFAQQPVLSRAAERVGSDLVVPSGRKADVRGLSDTEKAHPAEEARWVGSGLGSGNASSLGVVVAFAEAGTS
jgi:hypothetical protein